MGPSLPYLGIEGALTQEKLELRENPGVLSGSQIKEWSLQQEHCIHF